MSRSSLRRFCSQVTQAAFPDLYAQQQGRVASVSLVGPPNAGKSSLSNALIEHRVSAVSRKVNTTRSCPTGVYTRHDRQLMLCDTPGLVERAFLNTLKGARREVSSAAWGTAIDTDFGLFVVDASRSKKYLHYYAGIAGQLAEIRHAHFSRLHSEYIESQAQTPQDGPAAIPAVVKDQPLGNCVLVLNKSDVVRSSIRMMAVEDFLSQNIPNFEDRFHSKVFVTSASRGVGVDELRDYLLEAAPPSELVAPPGVPFLDDELDLIRQHLWEKLLHRLHQEIPYKCKFINNSFRAAANGDIHVSETIRAPSKSTCYMIVGSGGDVLRWIKEATEKSVSEVLGKNVELKLTVTFAKKKRVYAD